ncbi:uncharacterized protein LOC103173597 [Callorhinchus milii]|uniref:uncharacterized protein LOC103173597 n=1 Tax=Callorhinchus milii TaxID=7868 RepID=UPI001C3F6C0A|nr:uncharacterized protein LOC103173597 [Callorhinchus milii]
MDVQLCARGPGALGGPVRSGARSLGGPVRSGARCARGPVRSGARCARGPGALGGPVRSGARCARGPGALGGPVRSGPGALGGPVRSGPGALGGPVRSGPVRSGARCARGPGALGGSVRSGARCARAPFQLGLRFSSGSVSARAPFQLGLRFSSGSVSARAPFQLGLRFSSAPFQARLRFSSGSVSARAPFQLGLRFSSGSVSARAPFQLGLRFSSGSVSARAPFQLGLRFSSGSVSARAPFQLGLRFSSGSVSARAPFQLGLRFSSGSVSARAPFQLGLVQLGAPFIPVSARAPVFQLGLRFSSGSVFTAPFQLGLRFHPSSGSVSARAPFQLGVRFSSGSVSARGPFQLGVRFSSGSVSARGQFQLGSHSSDAGVICSDVLRLVNGGSPCAGRVEVYHDGQWGTVDGYGSGDSGWDMADAAVVCKELGCGAALSASGDAHFGEGSDPVVTWDVRCRGSESTLRDCQSQPWGGGYSWPHTYDAGVICTEPLQKPTISLKPDSRVFVRGESAEISCSGNYPGSNFSLYREEKFIASQSAPENNNTATFAPSEICAGNYWCKYAKHLDARELTSPESDRVGISLWDPLQKAKISLKPDSRVFVRGESAEISCSGNYPGSNFSLYREGKLLSSQFAPENNNTATFAPSEISAGNYWCKYAKHIDARELTSPESERVGISLWDPLQKAKISLKPNSRVFVRGERAEILCSGNYPGSNFSLYRDDAFIISQPAPENNNTVTFILSEISAANYTCKYTTQIDGRVFTSIASERMGITVRANWTWKHITGLAAGIVAALMIIVLLLGISEYKKGKQHSSSGERNVPTGGGPEPSNVTYAVVRKVPRSVPPMNADIIYANLMLGNRIENGHENSENDGPIYATVRV